MEVMDTLKNRAILRKEKKGKQNKIAPAFTSFLDAFKTYQGWLPCLGIVLSSSTSQINLWPQNKALDPVLKLHCSIFMCSFVFFLLSLLGRNDWNVVTFKVYVT